MADSMIYAYVLYISFAIFIIGFIYRIVKWANLPVPLKIVTTGQGSIDNPKSRGAVILRMASEVLLFISLFRNTKYDIKTNTIRSNRMLWLGAMVFHVSFLLIVLRHFRFFTYPVPSVIEVLNKADSFTPFMPSLTTITGILIIIALLYLFIRRLVFPEMRYISIFSDYLILLLLLAIVITGDMMKYFLRVDLIQVKEFMLGLISFSPVSTEIPWLFGLHLLLVSALLVYFPFSKLMHAPGIFFSPTRNQINNPRHARHVNPWNYPVKIQSFKEFKKEYENALKDVEE